MFNSRVSRNLTRCNAHIWRVENHFLLRRQFPSVVVRKIFTCCRPWSCKKPNLSSHFYLKSLEMWVRKRPQHVECGAENRGAHAVVVFAHVMVGSGWCYFYAVTQIQFFHDTRRAQCTLEFERKKNQKLLIHTHRSDITAKRRDVEISNQAIFLISTTVPRLVIFILIEILFE